MTYDDEAWMDRCRCDPLMVVLFTRQLATMFRVGIPFMQALETLSDQNDNSKFGAVVGSLATHLAKGYPFSGALAKFPQVFNRVYVTMVAIGEKTGQLSDCLEQLADWQEGDLGVKQRVIGALRYPCFILALAGLLTLAMFYFVLPQFLVIFEELKVELPATTKLLMQITNAVRNPGFWILLLAAIFLMWALLKDLAKTEQGARRIYRILKLIPVVGPILKFATASRYASAMSALLASGLDLQAAIPLAAHASGNPDLSLDSRTMLQAVLEGETLSEYMETRPDVYPACLTSMIAVGEEASTLPVMYENVATHFENEFEYRVDALGAAIEPLMLTGIAVIIGFIVISIFTPMYSFFGKLGL